VLGRDIGCDAGFALAIVVETRMPVGLRAGNVLAQHIRFAASIREFKARKSGDARR
jgi:hypothetical protein